MAAAELDYVAFARPGGETAEAAASHSLDFAHLARQTFGDRALEAEILSLFMQQVRSAGARLRTASADERKMLAHGLKGSARSIGAFELGDAAAALELAPGDGRIARRVCDRIDQVADLIAAINR